MEYQEYLDRFVAYDAVLMRRCWAAFFDYLIYVILVFLYGYFFGEINEWETGGGSFKFSVDPGFLGKTIIWILYFPLCEAVFGYTLAKGLLNLKVVLDRKNDFPFAVTFKRHLLDVVDFTLFGAVAVLTVKFTREHKRLGDLFAHSRVVQET